MSNSYHLYVLDCETTGLDYFKNEPIEISILRLTDGEQKTWWLKPINSDSISEDALRVNGHKLNDLLWKTKEGQEKYKDPKTIIVEIENWLSEDFVSSSDRFITGQNCTFDKIMLEELWRKCGSLETFPFSRKYSIDTMQIEFFMDYCKGNFAESYSLYNLCKKYGITNSKAHTAAADTLATKEVFMKQVDSFRKLMK